MILEYFSIFGRKRQYACLNLKYINCLNLKYINSQQTNIKLTVDIKLVTTDIKSMICNIPIVNVADQLPNETQDEYLNRKVSALQNIGEENKLFLIIDNYNTEFNSKDDLELFDKLTACVSHK